MNKFIYIIFIILLALVISGLNDFFSAKFENQAFLSPLILFLSILLIIYFLKQQRTLILFTPSARLFYITIFSFLIIGGLVGITDKNSSVVLKAYRFYLPSILIFWSGMLCFYNLLLTRTFEHILQLYRWILLLNIAVVLFTFFTKSELFIVNEVGSDVSGLLLNPNFAGFSANLLFAIELYFLRTKSSRFSYFIIPLVLFAILIGFSRFALLTCIGILLLNLFSRSEERIIRGPSKIFIYSILLIVVSTIWFSDLIKQALEPHSLKLVQMQKLLEGEVSSSTTGERSSLFSFGWRLIMESPIYGHGIHTFTRFQEFGSGVHNQYLLIWGESGIFPLIAYIYLHLYLWYKARYLLSDKKVLLRSFILAILFFSLTNHTMYANKNYIIILSLIISVIEYHLLFQKNYVEIDTESII